jgi:ComF family protein
LFYLPVFGKFLQETVERCFADSEILVPVPLHRLRHAQRGFNQAEELCEQLVSRVPLPVATDVRRIRITKSQSGLSAEDRHKNVDGAFAAGHAVRGRRALIVDDVMTTGQTCGALAATLLRAGASEVSVLTIARARQRL